MCLNINRKLLLKYIVKINKVRWTTQGLVRNKDADHVLFNLHGEFHRCIHSFRLWRFREKIKHGLFSLGWSIQLNFQYQRNGMGYTKKIRIIFWKICSSDTCIVFSNLFCILIYSLPCQFERMNTTLTFSTKIWHYIIVMVAIFVSNCTPSCLPHFVLPFWLY